LGTPGSSPDRTFPRPRPPSRPVPASSHLSATIRVNVISSRPVLVIEDDDDTRTALVEVLHLEKIRAVGAQDGAAAIDHFHEGLRPAVIVLDLGLPLVSGEQFLKARRLDPALASIPVVVITGREAKAEDFSGMNVKDVLRKPFDPWRVVEVVRRYCAEEGGAPQGTPPDDSPPARGD